MQFQELTDKQWSMMESHIPKPAKTGRPRSNDRKIINGIIYVLISGYRWSEMPKRYGDDSTANLRLNGSKKESGKRFLLVQSKLLIHLARLICNTYQLTHHQLVIKKGQHNRI